METEPAIHRIENPRKRAMLAVFAQTGNIVRSARATKVSRSQHYYWLDTDPDYAAAFEEARRQAIDILESEALRRAVEGTERVVLYKGRPVKHPETGEYIVVRHFSDRLLVELLRAAAPHRYRANYAATDTHDDGVRIGGRDREQVIRGEIAARQAVLDAMKGVAASHNRSFRANPATSVVRPTSR